MDALAIFVSRDKHPWAVVYVKNGDESKVLALNNTWPTATSFDKEKINVSQPLKVNLWNARSVDLDVNQLQVLRFHHRQRRMRHVDFSLSSFAKNLVEVHSTFLQEWMPPRSQYSPHHSAPTGYARTRPRRQNQRQTHHRQQEVEFEFEPSQVVVMEPQVEPQLEPQVEVEVQDLA